MVVIDIHTLRRVRHEPARPHAGLHWRASADGRHSLERIVKAGVKVEWRAP